MTRLRALSALSCLAPTAAAVFGLACGGGGPGFSGTIDTLPSGQIAVTNGAVGLWGDIPAWAVTEELRIGAVDGTGPDVLGDVRALEVDTQGNVYVFENQAQELRVFSPSGSHLRTIGRKGGGPGEFEEVAAMYWAPDGALWMVDPGNSRISVLDGSGAVQAEHRIQGGFIMIPWPGGFDDRGRFYGMTPLRSEEMFRMALVRHDAAMEPGDTLEIPRYDGPPQYFEMRSGNSMMRMKVPFTPGLTGYFVPGTSDYWFALTGEYRLVQRHIDGDTIRTITKAFDPLPVTDDDIDAALERFSRFLERGGEVDRSRIPSVKPALIGFYVDDAGYVWAMPTTDPDREGRLFEIFDPEGRFLGAIETPFEFSRYPRPVFRGDLVYGVVTDEVEVPYVVRARIHGRAAGAS